MEEEPRCNGMQWRAIVPAGLGLGISRMSLVAGDPSSAGGHCVVNVWVEIGGEEYAIATLSSEVPVVAGPPVVFGGEFVLRYDCAADIVQFDVDVLPLPASFDGEEAAVEYEPLSEDDQAGLYDSDNGADEGDGEEDEPGEARDGEATTGESSNIPLVAAPDGSVVPEGKFLGPARYAAVKNTAGFMLVAAAAEAAGDREAGQEILVLYRYTRFSRTRSGRRGVEVCRRTKLHRLRFAVPPAGDMASSMAWAGSSLGPLIYPALFRRQLQDLWSSLAPPAINAIPPQATRVQVIMDVGILRREDHTPERMELMRAALEDTKGEAWPAGYHGIRELHLPEPVWRRDCEDGTRPTRRKRVDDAEDDDDECSVCLEALESGLAAWPGCGHVFHGACVEKTLARSEMCPLCRGKLSDPCTRPSKRTRANVVCTRCSIR